MKRSFASDLSIERCLKRANSSLFSIATLVDDDVCTRGRVSSSNSISQLVNDRMSDILLVEDVVGSAGAKETVSILENSNLQRSRQSPDLPSPLKKKTLGVVDDNLDSRLKLKQGFVPTMVSSIPLDCSANSCDSPPDDAVSYSCSSSEFFVGDRDDDESNHDAGDVEFTERIGFVNEINKSTQAKELDLYKDTSPPATQPHSTDRHCRKVSEAPSESSITHLEFDEGLPSFPSCMPCVPEPAAAQEHGGERVVGLAQGADASTLPITSDARQPPLSFETAVASKSNLLKVDDIAIIDNATEPKVPGNEKRDLRTGLIFESSPKHFDRHNRFHKERPLRVTSIRDYLLKAKLQPNENSLPKRCQMLPCQDKGRSSSDSDPETSCAPKSPEELFLDDEDYLGVHLPGYMQRLDRISNCKCHNRLDREAEQFKSIYFTPDSVHEAKAAASSLCHLISRVVSGNLDNGFAVIRPPGHHAEPGLAGGYCVINNVAVAAAYAREKLGVKRVLIVDWDVHHGNGTQKCFIDNPDVLYFSVHRYHGGNFFPFLDQGGPSAVGIGDGAGFNINVGWNEKKMGDDEYLAVWEKLLMPVANEFNPDLVLISAGFDAARGDMGECDVTPECFARLTRRLKTLADGKVVCALEGGYVRSVLCKCVESVLTSLLDADSEEKCKGELQTLYQNLAGTDILDCINPSASRSLKATIKEHSKFWKCLQ